MRTGSETDPDQYSEDIAYFVADSPDIVDSEERDSASSGPGSSFEMDQLEHLDEGLWGNQTAVERAAGSPVCLVAGFVASVQGPVDSVGGALRERVVSQLK